MKRTGSIGARAAVLGLLAAWLGPATGQTPASPGAQTWAASDTVKLVRGYKKWTRANAKPIQMEPAAAAQCAAPWPNQRPSPHLQKFITVYVNTAGKRAMLEQRKPEFPVGTVIVKEKLAKLDSKKPELMTVMVKRAGGFNPDAGDWEYAVLDGAGAKVTAQGKLDTCESCHANAPARANDHVFRNYYLSESQRAALQ